MKVPNRFFKNVAEFKYLAATVTCQILFMRILRED
jgi:hypothetical protein